MRNLSKSKIIAFRQCPKRLWSEIHKPELRDDSASQAAFAIGNGVGEVARQVFDPQDTGDFIDIGALGHSEAIARSATLLEQGNGPIFEAGISAAGALAYADVMLPDRSDDGLRWRMIEVKSSTGVRDCQLDDIAVQSFIAKESGVPLASVSIAHINNSFIYPGGGDYGGLFETVDLTEETICRHEEVRDWLSSAHALSRFRNILLRRPALGRHPPHPILSLSEMRNPTLQRKRMLTAIYEPVEVHPIYRRSSEPLR